jgi:foldase protein PrsA
MLRDFWMVAFFPAAAAVLAGPAAAAPAKSSVMATVNGVAINRANVEARTWQRYSTAMLSEMVDETLIQQAADALRVQADTQEIEARIKRIQGQFPSEAVFKERLAASGTSLDSLRSQIKNQVLREALVIKAKNLKVSDTEAKEFFETHKDKLSAGDSMHLRAILVATEKEADDFLVALKAGADFAKLASQASLDQATKVQGGDLGYISKGMLQPNLEQAVSALNVGEISAPIKAQAGFVIFKKEEVKPAKPAVFTEVENAIRQTILNDKISAAWPAYLKELREQAKITTSAQPASK